MDLNSFNLTGKLVELLFQITLSLVMADAARLNSVVTSFVELPSFVKVEPRYLKLSTSSSFYPFNVMEVVACWVRLFTMTAFLRAYFHSVCSFQSGGEILEFCFATSH